MAEALGMKYQQYARYEKGVTVPGADIIAQICTVHSCSSDWLLGIERGDSAAVKTTVEKDCETCPFKQLVLAFQASAAKLPRK
jgi:transcriptional regulator with XRE-family HTH domain